MYTHAKIHTHYMHSQLSDFADDFSVFGNELKIFPIGGLWHRGPGGSLQAHVAANPSWPFVMKVAAWNHLGLSWRPWRMVKMSHVASTARILIIRF